MSDWIQENKNDFLRKVINYFLNDTASKILLTQQSIMMRNPHMHLGVVPMRDGKLQGKNVFNRQELLWLQDKFPEHMKKQGFELKRGDRGSDRKHIETAKFKKQTLEKEIDFLEKNLAVKKDEWTAYSDKVKSDLEVPAKRHMKNVEVPTGEKSMFGLG